MRRALLIPLLLLGCSEVSTPGKISVSWWMLGLTCQKAGIERVEAALFAFDEVEPSVRAEATCEAGEITLTKAPPGDYSLILKGYDAEGCWVLSGREEEVEVVSRTKRVVENLTFATRSRPLRVDWGLAGEACADKGVEQVRVAVTQGAEEISQVFICEGGARALAVEPQRSPMEIEVEGLDMRGNIIAYAEGAYDEAVFDEAACLDVVDLKIPLCARGECAVKGAALRVR